MFVDEDVVALEVAVELSSSVNGIQSPQHLSEDVCDDWFRDGPPELGYEVVECAIVHVLDEHEEGILHGCGFTW